MYLSYINVQNFRGIKSLEVNFHPSINLIIGENGSHKSTLIDAIRVLYNIGNQQKAFYLSKEDIHHGEKEIEIEYHFRGLDIDQKGAFYECLVIEKGKKTEDDYARFKLKYAIDNAKEYLQFSFNTGQIDGQRADVSVFERLSHYYLGALRDSTRDLLSTKSNLLGGLIFRMVQKNKNEAALEKLLEDFNTGLQSLKETGDSRDSVNVNLQEIYKSTSSGKIGIYVDGSEPENIVNIIKPYLPFDQDNLLGGGLSIKKHSLGYNNLIYIATVLGDLKKKQDDESVSHFALLIEEPEAHLHPQLQLSLYNFFNANNVNENSQLFITTHSPTLTSKVPFEHLIYLSPSPERAICIADCFTTLAPAHEEVERVTAQFVPEMLSSPVASSENVELEREAKEQKAASDANIGDPEEEDDEEDSLGTQDPVHLKKMLERYIDVTRSQLFYAKGIILVEGISEALLLPGLAALLDVSIVDYKLEVVNVDGTSFSPFIPLFSNSGISIPAVILTDGDEFTESNKKEYSAVQLLKDNSKIKTVLNGIVGGEPSSRIKRMAELVTRHDGIVAIFVGKKTFEFELVISNIPLTKTDFIASWLYKIIQPLVAEGTWNKFNKYLATLPDNLEAEDRSRLSVMTWKIIPKSLKAEFAHTLSVHISDNLEELKKTFIVPEYIRKALFHVTGKNDGAA